jgi:hypothetical protein
MKCTMVFLFAGLFLGRSFASEPEGPSIELLFYLAEWSTDEQGQLLDPLDVPDDVGFEPGGGHADTGDDQRKPVEEYSR